MSPLDCLCRYPLFALLGRRKLDAWLGCGRVLSVATGETLFQAGTPGTWAYLVLEGRARVVQTAESGRDVPLGAFGPGELFGEYALLPPHLNTATCRAAEPGRLVRLPLVPLRQAFARQPEVQVNLKRWLRLHVLLGFLRRQAFMGFMSVRSSWPLIERCRPVAFPAGHTIQAEGLSADRWYFLESGQVRLSPGRDGGPGEALGPGDSFGEQALLGRAELPVAEALSDCTCLALARQDFCPAGEAGEPSVQTLAGRPAPAGAYPWVGQQGEADCGVAALAMIARWHGRPVSVEGLRASVRLGEGGASLLELGRAAARLGLAGQAVRAGPERLGEVALPAIAHLSGGHYVAVYAVRDEGVVVGDPASGVLTWSLDLFRRACSGGLLVFGAGAAGRGPAGP